MKSNMKQLYYYSDAVLKYHDNRYSIDYYCSDGKTRMKIGEIKGKSYKDILTLTRNIIKKLNEPKPLFGRDGRLSDWIQWKKKIRNQKIFNI